MKNLSFVHLTWTLIFSIGISNSGLCQSNFPGKWKRNSFKWEISTLENNSKTVIFKKRQGKIIEWTPISENDNNPEGHSPNIEISIDQALASPSLKKTVTKGSYHTEGEFLYIHTQKKTPEFRFKNSPEGLVLTQEIWIDFIDPPRFIKLTKVFKKEEDYP